MEGIEQIQNGEQMSSVRNKLNQVITGAVSHDEAAEEFVAQDQTGVQEVSDSDTIVSPNIMFRATLTQDSETTEAKISGADLLNAMQENIEGGGGGGDYRPISNANIPAMDFSPETPILNDTIQFNVTKEEATAKKVNGDQLIAAVRHALSSDWESVPEIGRPDEDQMDNYYIPLRDRDGNYYKMPLRLVFE